MKINKESKDYEKKNNLSIKNCIKYCENLKELKIKVFLQTNKTGYEI